MQMCTINDANKNNNNNNNINDANKNHGLQLPSPSEALREATSLLNISLPIALTALLLYSRSIISMLFLGSLGDLPLAAGSLAIAFANITGYSILSGLSLGAEPLCSQASGASRPDLLSLSLLRSSLLLLSTSLPLSFLWLNSSKILTFFNQDPEIASLAQSYLLFSLPDLFSFSLINPIRVYLRSQSITRPLTLSAAISALLHLPANLIASRLNLGVPGIAAASAISNVAMLLVLLPHGLQPLYPSIRECLSGWGPLTRLAAPSCASVCLEWWWYELLIILCGLLPDPKPAIAAMGVLIQTTALVYVFPSSLGSGASARVGNELGANRPGRAKSAAGVAVAIAGLLGFIAMGFAAGVRQRWGRMFTHDGEIVRLTAAALPIVGLCEVGNCPQTVGCGVLRGSARPAHAARINLGAFYLVGMPVAVGLGLGLGLGFCGLWMGLLAAQICCAGFMIYIVGTTDWEAQARRAQLLTYGGSSSSELLDQLEVMEEGKGTSSFVSENTTQEDNKETDQEISFQPLIIANKILEIER